MHTEPAAPQVTESTIAVGDGVGVDVAVGQAPAHGVGVSVDVAVGHTPAHAVGVVVAVDVAVVVAVGGVPTVIDPPANGTAMATPAGVVRLAFATFSGVTPGATAWNVA